MRTCETEEVHSVHKLHVVPQSVAETENRQHRTNITGRPRPDYRVSYGSARNLRDSYVSRDAAKKMQGIRLKSIKKQKTKEEYKKAKKEIRELSRKKQRLLMKRCIKETLRTAIFNAYFSPPQIIMSDRMRKLSNIILKDFCRIMKLVIPDRKDESKR